MIWYLDIETRVTRNEFPFAEKALEEISLIQIVRDNKVTVLGTRQLKKFKNDVDFEYIMCLNEVEMLKDFAKLLEYDNPLIVYAWNGNRFDFPYLFNRFKNLGLDVNKLSLSKDITLTEDHDRYCGKLLSSSQRYADLMILYKCFGDTLKSYSLDSVSKHELNDCKVKHDEFDDFDSFYTGKNYTISEEPYDDEIREEIRQLKILERDNKITDEQKSRLYELIYFNYVYYGVKDTLLMKRIDDKVKITEKII